MGLKFKDIFIKHHNHSDLLKYLRTFQFKEFLEEKPTVDFVLHEETFTLQKLLRVDTREVCTWEDDIGQNKLVFETNASVPWIYLQLQEAFDLASNADELAEYISRKYPEAAVSLFSYNSVTDYTNVESYKSGIVVRSIIWSPEAVPPITMNFGCKESCIKKEPWEAWIIEIAKSLGIEGGEPDCSPLYLVRYYWTRLFPEIPNRYFYLEDMGMSDAWESHEQMLKHLDNVLEAEPRCTDFWFEKGYILNELGQYEEAIEIFNKILSLKPDSMIWPNLAFAYSHLGKYDQAILCYDRAIKAGGRKFLVDKAIVLIKQKKYHEAIKSCDELIAEFLSITGGFYTVSCIEAIYTKACVYALMGDKKNSLQFLEQAIMKDPKNKQLAQEDEDFSQFWEDEDFRRIVT